MLSVGSFGPLQLNTDAKILKKMCLRVLKQTKKVLVTTRQGSKSWFRIKVPETVSQHWTHREPVYDQPVDKKSVFTPEKTVWTGLNQFAPVNGSDTIQTGLFLV